jgi:hypothetical protein
MIPRPGVLSASAESQNHISKSPPLISIAAGKLDLGSTTAWNSECLAVEIELRLFRAPDEVAFEPQLRQYSLHFGVGLQGDQLQERGAEPPVRLRCRQPHYFSPFCLHVSDERNRLKTDKRIATDLPEFSF